MHKKIKQKVLKFIQVMESMLIFEFNSLASKMLVNKSPTSSKITIFQKKQV